MGLQSDLAVIQDATFQGRCWVALLQIANKVLNEEAGYPAAGQVAASSADDITFARRIMRDEVSVSREVIANLVMRNSTVAANPTTDTVAIDDAIRWEINNQAWAELRGIG